jgi:hypothetical protein
MTPLTHLVLPLRGGNWTRLLKLVTTPSTRSDGGWQMRKRKWMTRVNEATKSIELDPDDIDFIRRQIMNMKGGGFQRQFYDIFAGQHPQFSRLPIAPRKKPEQRKARAGSSDDITVLPLAAKPQE